jgi:hypothetical protein
MNSLALLRLRHSTETLNYVRDRIGARIALLENPAESIDQRESDTKEFTGLYDQKWIEMKQRHRVELYDFSNP